MRQKSKENVELKKWVRKAAKLPDPLSLLADSDKSSIKTLDDDFELVSCYGTHIDDPLFEWVFGLFEKNMRALYVKSQWGWNPKEKRAELQSTTSRYLIIYKNIPEVDKIPIAYCHYRFDMDDGSPVIYLYEIQVERDYQEQGIGSWLVKTVEKVAQKSRMSKVVMTVFKFNEQSLKFFTNLGFKMDDTSPYDEDDCDYEIMSKAIEKN